MTIEIRELLGEGKGVATSTIKNFHQRKTNPRKRTVDAIQEQVEKEKKKEIESEDDKNNENINISNNNIIDNEMSDSKNF